MFARIVFGTALALTALAGRPAGAQDVDRIAAVVNDDIITMQEVDQRVRMAMVLSNLPDGQDARRRIVPQVVRKMIDERLQMQEANRLKVSLSAADVEAGIANIEEQNRQPRGSLLAMLQRAGVDPAAARDQIRADMTWYRVVARQVQPNIRIGEEEVKDRLETIKARQGQPEYNLSEIFLPIDNPSQEDEMRRLAERLQEQLRAGAPFPALASQFSRSPTAANGGAMGWVSDDMLDEDVLKAVRDLQPGQVSPLIRSADGLRLVALADRRIAGSRVNPEDATVVLGQIVLPVPPDGPPKQQLAGRAAELTRNAKSCDELEAIGRKLSASVPARMAPAKVDELPLNLRAIGAQLPVGRPSPPIDVQAGLQIMMVCSRQEATTIQLPSEAAVRRMIEAERSDMMARRYMRDLRRAAFIDIRM